MKIDYLDELNNGLNEVKKSRLNYSELYNKISDNVKKFHHESDGEQMSSDARVYKKHPGNGHGASAVSLVCPYKMPKARIAEGIISKSKEDFKENRMVRRYSRDNRRYLSNNQVERKFKVFTSAENVFKRNKRKIAIFFMSSALVAVFTVPSFIQHASYTESTQITQTIDLPNEIYGEYDLAVQKNGEVYFQNASGKHINTYKDYNAGDTYMSYVKQL